MKIKIGLAKLIISCALFCLSVCTCFAANFPFEPPQNFVLRPDYINVRHPVTTSSLLAQLYFDQGFTFLYAFNHDAAYWSFLRAAGSDPNMAMAYWGMALALGSNINMEATKQNSEVAYRHIQKAIQLSSNISAAERDYIKALAQRYSNQPDADVQRLAQNYSSAMRKLSQTYLDDLDAATLYAESLLTLNPWSQWSLDGKPLEGTMEAVRTLESVLKRDPQHLGANHYFIHAVEASKHPEIALMSAERLKTLLPSSGHILHMPSHIYILVGDYLEAAHANENAVAVDRQYIQDYGISGIYPLHYLSHNLYFLARAYNMLGRFEDAYRAANQLATFYMPHFKHMPELEYYASAPLTVLVTFHRWKDLLQQPRPPEELQMTKVLWHFGRGMAYANLGDFTAAKKEQRLFEEGKRHLPSKQVFGYNRAEKILNIAHDCLTAQLAEAEGNDQEAINALKSAIAEQDSLHYNEPPDWFFPVRETLGGLLLRLERPEEAEIVFREDLNRHPRNGRALFGLRESLQAQNKMADLFWVERAFRKAWMYSDISLTINDL